LGSESHEYEEDAGVVVRRFPLFDLCQRFPSVPGLGPANILGLGIQTRRAVRDLVEAHDVIHAHGVSVLTAFALSVARKLHRPFLCKVTSSGPGTDLKKLSEIGVGGSILAYYMRDYVTAWVATTNAVAESLKDYGVRRQRIIRIPNGVALPKPDTSQRTHSKLRRFLYVGRLSRACDRDFDTLFGAFSHLAMEYEDVEIALVGDGDLFCSIKTKASQSQFASRVHMPGLVEDPSEWFKWADCFVLPSRREGMSNALLGAMTFGLVCVANDIPPNREVLDDGRVGYLTPVGDMKELLRCMKLLVASCVEYAQLSKFTLARAQREYAIEVVVSRYLTVYKCLMGEAKLIGA
jgi:glycosyltransferase involved in cell wall biosynthesis